MYRSVYCGIEVCIVSWACREMMGLWFGSPTFGVSDRLVRNPTSIRRGDAGLRPYSYCPQDQEITTPALDRAIRQPAAQFTGVPRRGMLTSPYPAFCM
jgi:hypothetical protein